MKANAAKKLGRRKAGSWGRPGSKHEKRAASKGVRKSGKKEVRHDAN
jgi:hypothetical protein